MSVLLLAYDTESDACLESVKKIVKVHEKHEYPATFFIVSRLLDEQGDEYKAILKDHPLFEIASHTMTHMLLRHNRWGGGPGPEEKFHDEIVGSKGQLENHFKCSVKGFRSPYGWPEGLSGADNLLPLIREAGYEYTSTVSWGKDTTLPAPLNDVFTYKEDGYPEIIEFPLHGWHDNVAKGIAKISFEDLRPDPHPIPELKLTKPLETPEEEIALNRVLMKAGLNIKAPYVTPIWHPWSLNRFDPEMKMVDGVISTANELGFSTSTFAEYAEKLAVANQ